MILFSLLTEDFRQKGYFLVDKLCLCLGLTDSGDGDEAVVEGVEEVPLLPEANPGGTEGSVADQDHQDEEDGDAAGLPLLLHRVLTQRMASAALLKSSADDSLRHQKP